MSSDFGKEWFLKWAQGTVIGYVRSRIELNRAKGMLKTAIKSIGEEKISQIIKNMEESPVYLPDIPREEKVERLNLLKKELNLNLS